MVEGSLESLREPSEEVTKMSLGLEDFFKMCRKMSVTTIGPTVLTAKFSRICSAGFLESLETPLLLMRQSR